MFDTFTKNPIHRMNMLFEALEQEVESLKEMKKSCFGGVLAFFSYNIDDKIKLKEEKLKGLTMLKNKIFQPGGIKSKDDFSEMIINIKKTCPKFEEGSLSRVSIFVTAVKDYFSKGGEKLSLTNHVPSSSDYSHYNQF